MAEHLSGAKVDIEAGIGDLADVLYGGAEDPCTDVVLHVGVHALGTACTEGCFPLDDDATIASHVLRLRRIRY